MRLCILLGIALICAISCKKEEAKQPMPAWVESALSDKAFISGEEGAQTTRSEELMASLAQGTAYIWGIKIPRGMVPGTAPEGVYRFEGSHPLGLVTTAVKEQIFAREAEKEQEGYLWRGARVRSGFGGTLPKEKRLSIRVSRRKDRSYLDIWLEPERAQLAKGLDRHSGRPLVKTTSKTVHVKRSNLRQNRAKESAKTYEVMKKVHAGKRLGADELSNPYLN